LGTTLALVAVSMLVGGAGTHALTHGIDEQAAALYLARSEAQLEIAETRLDHFARELAKTQELVQQGMVTERESRRVEARFLQAQSETEIRKLELAETIITSKEPNDALSAPLVYLRDFVTERMAAQHRPMQLRLEIAIDHTRRYQELFEAGVVTTRELKTAQTGVVAAEAELIGLEKRSAIRASFLTGELSAADVELRGMRLTAIAARGMALRQVEVLVQQHQRFTDRSERGAVSGSELRAVQTDLRTAQARVELADLELRILDQKLDAVTKGAG
jgi:multidrug resistance efflux pump